MLISSLLSPTVETLAVFISIFILFLPQTIFYMVYYYTIDKLVTVTFLYYFTGSIRRFML